MFQPEMIIESLKAMLFGMIGIFVTMGIIMTSLIVLNSVSKEKKEEDDED